MYAILCYFLIEEMASGMSFPHKVLGFFNGKYEIWLSETGDFGRKTGEQIRKNVSKGTEVMSGVFEK